MKRTQRSILFIFLSRLTLLCTVTLHIAGCSNDNIEYKLINKNGLLCKIIGLKASKRSYEDGIMTPVDGVFTMFSCQINEPGEKTLRKIIPMKSKETPYGILQSSSFGEFKVEYYRTGVWERIYMTEYQIDGLKDFIRDR